jgi:hypothetical protein
MICLPPPPHHHHHHHVPPPPQPPRIRILRIWKEFFSFYILRVVERKRSKVEFFWQSCTPPPLEKFLSGSAPDGNYIKREIATANDTNVSINNLQYKPSMLPFLYRYHCIIKHPICNAVGTVYDTTCCVSTVPLNVVCVILKISALVVSKEWYCTHYIRAMNACKQTWFIECNPPPPPKN